MKNIFAQSNTFITTFFIGIGLLISLSIQAQGWLQNYHFGTYDAGPEVLVLNDGYAVCGHTNASGNNTESDVFLFKTDAYGELLWMQTYGEANELEFAYDISATNDGGFLIVGAKGSVSNIYLLKIAADGTEEWTQTMNVSGSSFANEVKELPNGDFILTGTARGIGLGKMLLIRIDADGNELWTEILSETAFGSGAIGNDVALTNDGGFIVSGARLEEVDGLGTFRWAYVVKTDANGQVEWTHEALDGAVENASGSEVKALLQTPDGSYALAGIIGNNAPDENSGIEAPQRRAWLAKLDVDGNLLWETEDVPDGNSEGYALSCSPDGSFIMTGREEGEELSVRKILFLKYDNDGNLMWDKTLGFFGKKAFGTSLQLTSDNGLILTGMMDGVVSDLDLDIFLAKTNFDGDVFLNTVEGTVASNLDGDCLSDGTEGLNNVIVEAVGNYTFYTNTDENGFYSLNIDTGLYTLNFYYPSPYWTEAVCNSNGILLVADSTQNDTINFFLEPIILCPYLEVAVSTPLLRRCFDNTYTVQYCNNGTAEATDAFIEVQFDDDITVNASAIPWTLEGETYVFEIGDLMVNECASFQIEVTLGCEEVLLGETHCVEAHIYPDSLCTLPPTIWDGANLEITANCLSEDTVEFIVQNNGEDMIAMSNARIIEDNIMVEDLNVFLLGSEEIRFTRIATGSTYLMEVEQTEGHPSASRSYAFVEACGGNDPSSISLGYVTSLALGDEAPFVDIDCQENIGSWDPNDKQVVPKGYSDENYIRRTDDLEYKIRFQNTGTDTAFQVVIRDTLSPYLDVSSIRSGVSSHDYEFRVLSEQVIEWRFNQINLPDSTTNEPASHGYVKFFIEQKEGNPQGAVIGNRAAIYFDFNEAVITNLVKNVLLDNIFENPNIVVPITLMEFTGRVDANDNLLEWTSASEDNLDYYSLYHSRDGTHFELLKELKPESPNSNTIRKYEWRHKQPLMGKNYYLLEQTDLDGNQQREAIVVIDNQLLKGEYKIGPNPFEKETSISLFIPNPERIELALYNVTGACVNRQDIDLSAGQNVWPLDLSALPKGIYFVKLQGERTYFGTRKILKK